MRWGRWGDWGCNLANVCGTYAYLCDRPRCDAPEVGWQKRICVYERNSISIADELRKLRQAVKGGRGKQMIDSFKAA